MKPKKSGILLLAGFSKAFDSISYKFILSSLEIFGYKKTFINQIKRLLQDFQCSILIKRHFYIHILFKRRCRQGNPIVGYLFILVIEILYTTSHTAQTFEYQTKSALPPAP